MTKFSYGLTELVFNCDPVRGGDSAARRDQPLGRYSDGSVVVYDKSDRQRVRHELPFVRLNGVTLNALLDFLDSVEGVRYPFAWTDHLGVARTVRFSAGQIEHLQTGPDRYAATLTLIEREEL